MMNGRLGGGGGRVRCTSVVLQRVNGVCGFLSLATVHTVIRRYTQERVGGGRRVNRKASGTLGLTQVTEANINKKSSYPCRNF